MSAAAWSAGGAVAFVALVFLALAILDPDRLDPRPRHLRKKNAGRPGIATLFDVDLDDEPYLNPDCAQGKHKACAGDAWNLAADELTECTCHCHTKGAAA
ncbi:hypothetical protein ACFT5B_11840 [Luteimicrobium sp. NPDC057192]|uniref:hypothetical protein n=1 Tax=Luteimicrobium sp. NPDC057192 TaxID=3346042 RepID=UPI0036367544